MIKIVNSIEKVTQSRHTGQRPVVVSAADGKDYFCKYALGIPAQELMTEWVCWPFYKDFGLNVAPMVLIHLQTGHFPDHNIGIWNCVDRTLPLIGFENISGEFVTQATETLFQSFYHRGLILDKYDILKIALMDVFLANEDRLGSNYNLLISSSGNAYTFHPIDHGASFNGKGGLTTELYPLSFEDSILSSLLVKRLFKGARDFDQVVNKILKEFDELIKRIKLLIYKHIDDAPEGWTSNKAIWHTLFKHKIFNPKWIKESKENFNDLCAQFYDN